MKYDVIPYKEHWKDICGYEGIYQISDLGNVKSLNFNHTNKPKLRALMKAKDGYLFLRLHKNGKAKNYRVHRLVAEAFIPNPNNFPLVNHKDETVDNNCVQNLEWCTEKYNSNYGHRGEKLSKAHTNHSKKSFPVMCIETGKIYPSIREAERQTNIHNQAIRRVAGHLNWSAGKKHWVDYMGEIK